MGIESKQVFTKALTMSTHSSQKRKRGRDRERSPYKPRFTDEQIDAIPLIAWKQHEQESKIQQSLFWDCWKQQMSAKHRRIIFQMLTIYKDKKEKFWFDNVKRALHSFKPPRHPMSEWTEYCKLFKQHADTSAYAETASTLILPVLMQSDTASLKTLYASFKCAVEQLSQANPQKYKGPSLRSLSSLLLICCKNLKNENDSDAAIEIAFDLFKLSKHFKIDLSKTTSSDFFDSMFTIFAHAKS